MGGGGLRQPVLWVHPAELESNLVCLHVFAATLGAELEVVTKVYGGDRQMLELLHELGVDKYAEVHVRSMATIRSLSSRHRIASIRQLPRADLTEAIQLDVDSFVAGDHAGATALARRVIPAKEACLVQVAVRTIDDREGLEHEALADVLADLRRLLRRDQVEIAASFGCRGPGVLRPDVVDAEVLRIANLAATCSTPLTVGGSSILQCHVKSPDLSPISRIRIGEALALGTDGLGRAVQGLSSQAFVLTAEVLQVMGIAGRRASARALVAVGEQDIASDSLQPLDPGISISYATSDHLMVEVSHSASVRPIRAGDLLEFKPGYRSLLRLFLSPFVVKRFCSREDLHGHY